MRKIGVVTVARSDYGIFYPLLRAIEADDELQLMLFVGGSHFSKLHGETFREIEKDGFPIVARLNFLAEDDSPAGVARSIGQGTIQFADAFTRDRPDILLVLGDRYDMFAAAIAALPLKIPIGHIHGGESSEGAIDEAIRHAITKMSHLHFASAEPHALRILQMGEEPWRVAVSGAPALDYLEGFQALDRGWFQQKYGVELKNEFFLVTFHPVSLEFESVEWQVNQLLEALEEVGHQAVITYPNADTHGRKIIDAIEGFKERHPEALIVRNLGTQAYFSLMAMASAQIGNSSSGVIEAASFRLPVVDIGVRQRGRCHGKNVIHVGESRSEITSGIRQVLSADFQQSIAEIRNPYGEGGASKKIIARLKIVELDQKLLMKRFVRFDPMHFDGEEKIDKATHL